MKTLTSIKTFSLLLHFGCLAIWLLAATAPAYGQTVNEITTVSPTNTAQGAAKVLVTFTLAAGAIPVPPAGAPVTSVTLGAITGSLVTHDSQYIVTAQFAIPALEPAGWKDAAIVFTPPIGSTLTYSKTAAFQVTAGSGVAASFTGVPTSGKTPLTVSFTDASTGTITNRLWSFGDGATSTAVNPAHTYTNTGSYTVSLAVFAAAGSNTLSRAGYITVTATPTPGGYVVVDTSQTQCYNDTNNIAPPAAGQPFYGQDAQFSGTQPSYTKSVDGLTVKDNVTGLTWQQSHYTGQVYWEEAQAVATAMNATNYGGCSDWRLPAIKELYSLWNGNTGWPYIDTNYFTISYASEEELSHAIFWSSSKYSGLLESTGDPNVGAELAFGVNFGTGHIKAYSIASGPRHLVRCVRGASCGINGFLDQGDGTITDQATGLMWAQTDSGSAMDWEHALAYAQTQNAANYLGHSDWRLPDTKELQSLVDYTRSPGATNPANVGPAINPLFTCTGITNEAGSSDFPYYWTSTSAKAQANEPFAAAWYVAFGRAVGSDGKDLHGAGAVRFDTKIAGTPGGDRYYNYVRLLRAAPANEDTVGDGIPDWWRRQYFGGHGTTTNSQSCATCDPDGDGVPNASEYAADTNPTNALSRFHLQSISNPPGGVITFQSSASRRYTLYYAASLDSGAWTNIPSQTGIPGNGGVDTLTDPAPASAQRFYRIGVRVP